ncbi:hypothetical protein [Nocardia brasiliensis]|uniref:hypothetical protein n=1 Tax=Nocardia brasiliensis TaxID=37326 RepID=UPI002455493C|nr:hypothetical protein [Nocardia brasiliensis]
MNDDEQMTMDLGVPVERTEWSKWADPQRRAAQSQKFMERIGIRSIPDEFSWFSDVEDSANNALSETFPDMELPTPEHSSELVDAFLCFLGEYLTKFADAEWYDSPVKRDSSIYENINPALRYRGSKDTTATELLQDILDHGRELDGRIFTSAMVISHELHLNSL